MKLVHSPAACVPTAFLVLRKLHECFYNRFMISKILKVNVNPTARRLVTIESLLTDLRKIALVLEAKARIEIKVSPGRILIA